MRRNLMIISVLAGIVTVAAIACTSGLAGEERAKTEGKSKQAEHSNAISQDSLVKRGEYLVNTIGCDDCHSPKVFTPTGFEIDMERRLSGHPANEPVGKVDHSVVKEGWVLFGQGFTSAVGPWGMSFSANLTSDETGIGNWKEEQFIKALREGKYKGLDGTRPLLPPMPWFVYKNMTDNDLKAIFAYLKTTKPVKNLVPAPRPMKNL